MSIITILALNDFYERLKNKTLSQSSNYRMDKSIIFDNSKIVWESRTIHNFIFDELVTVVDVDIQFGLHFVNCQFKKGIVFKNVKNTLKTASEEDLEGGGICFSNCQSEFILFGNACDIERGISIKAKCDIKKIQIIDSKARNRGLKISKSTISNLLGITACNLELHIDNSEINTLRVESNNGNISLIKSKFTDWAKFWNIECPNNFTLNYNVFENTFDIKASRVKGLFIHGDTFQRKGHFENRDDSGNGHLTFLNEIYITDANFVESFEFDGMGKNLKKVTLPFSSTFNGVLKIYNWNINEVLISGINQNLKLIFSKNNFKRIVLNDFSNFGTINFDECKSDNINFKTDEDPDSSIIISNTSLGNTRFSEFDFNSFNFINILNASFEGIEASNVKWFSDEKLQINSQIPVDEIGFRRKRELYRQIKQTLRSKGNQIDSLIFQSREMRAYRDELRNSKNYSCGDRIIMTVNQTNDYGVNWTKPFLLIILITFITYVICLPLFSEKMDYHLCGKFIAFDVFWKEFGQKLPSLAQMFNPARNFLITYGTNASISLYFIDLLHRVVLGILIFQLISSFRRLSNK